MLSFIHSIRANTLRLEHNGCHLQTFSNTFPKEKICILIHIHQSLFHRVQFTISQLWFKWWFDTEQVTSHYQHQWSWWRHQMETFSALLALCAGNSPVPVNSPHKGQWRRALMFSLIYAWIKDWVNNREAGDLRRHRGHYDVIVMWSNSIMHICITGPQWVKNLLAPGEILSSCSLRHDSRVTGWSFAIPGPLLLTWFNFNLSLDK